MTVFEPTTFWLAWTANTFLTKRIPVVRAANAVIRYCAKNQAMEISMRVESMPLKYMARGSAGTSSSDIDATSRNKR